MMHRVAQETPILKYDGGRLEREIKTQASLVSFAARLHAQLHDTFAHPRFITEFRDVLYRVNHRISAACRATGNYTSSTQLSAPAPIQSGNRNRFGEWHYGPEHTNCECCAGNPRAHRP